MALVVFEDILSELSGVGDHIFFEVDVHLPVVEELSLFDLSVHGVGVKLMEVFGGDVKAKQFLQ